MSVGWLLDCAEKGISYLGAVKLRWVRALGRCTRALGSYTRASHHNTVLWAYLMTYAEQHCPFGHAPVDAITRAPPQEVCSPPPPPLEGPLFREGPPFPTAKPQPACSLLRAPPARGSSTGGPPRWSGRAALAIPSAPGWHMKGARARLPGKQRHRLWICSRWARVLELWVCRRS